MTVQTLCAMLLTNCHADLPVRVEGSAGVQVWYDTEKKVLYITKLHDAAFVSKTWERIG